MVIEPRIGLFLAGDHPEQRRLAGAVRADDADNAARRQLERQVVDQQPVAIALLRCLASITWLPSRSPVGMTICASPGRGGRRRLLTSSS
jgi:hypothetical protein